MKTYLLKLKLVAKSIIWGGNKLPKEFNIGQKGKSVSEAWMLCC